MQPKHLKIAAAVVALLILIWAISVFVGRSKDNNDASTANSDVAQEAVVDPAIVPLELEEGTSPLSGVKCDNYDKRPFAIMYSGDVDARRNFKNLSKADIVAEIPHRPMHGQPRLMAIFQCETPSKIGPMRSGRSDHISVAGAFDAVYIPWGKSAHAGVLLSEGVIDSMNCDAISGSSACFIDSSVSIKSANPAFSSMPELIKLAEQKGFRNTTNFTGYKRQAETPRDQRPSGGRLTVGFEDPYRAHFNYDPQTNTFKRTVNEQPDIDVATNEQIAPKNVIVIPAKKEGFRNDIDYSVRGVRDPWIGIDEKKKEELHDQYPNLALGDPWFDTKREGEAFFYMNGKETVGVWKREKGIEKPYQFFDSNGGEIHFVPGQIWIEVPEQGRTVKWKAPE